MGWNDGYEILENTVVTIYDLGVLTEDVLEKLIVPFKRRDVDHGGCNFLLSKDGLSCDEILIKVLDPKRFEEFMKIKNEENEEYGEILYEAYEEVVYKRYFK